MNLVEKLKQTPQSPGIYRMEDSRGNILYVGKAKNLKNRISQYFRNQKDRPPKIAELIKNIHSFSYTETDTELDALIEECRLIKEIKPRYNSQMKNDRGYTFIKIPAEPFPKIAIVTEKANDGALYFGPFTSRHRVECAVEYLNDFYPVRKCTTQRFVKRDSGCLFSQLGTCSAACTGLVRPDEYQMVINDIRKLLEGEGQEAFSVLAAKIEEAVCRLEFEKAAKLRPYYTGLRHVIGKQRLVQSSNKSRNILVVEFMDRTEAKLFLIKGNRLLFGQKVNQEAIDSSGFQQDLKQNIREKLSSSKIRVHELKQEDLDEAQIIYSYLKKNKDRILSFWIPESRIDVDGVRLDATIGKILEVISLEIQKRQKSVSCKMK